MGDAVDALMENEERLYKAMAATPGFQDIFDRESQGNTPFASLIKI